MEKTKAQKDAQKKYMEKFNGLRVRMGHEKAETVKAHAEAQGESVNGLIKRAIDETMARDSAAGGVVECDGVAGETG